MMTLNVVQIFVSHFYSVSVFCTALLCIWLFDQSTMFCDFLCSINSVLATIYFISAPSVRTCRAENVLASFAECK